MKVRHHSSACDESEPILHASHVDAEGVPHASFLAMRAFLYEWAAVDPNGIWAPEGLSEADGILRYDDELGTYEWKADGRGSYALTGWPWWIEDEA